MTRSRSTWCPRATWSETSRRRRTPARTSTATSRSGRRWSSPTSLAPRSTRTTRRARAPTTGWPSTATPARPSTAGSYTASSADIGSGEEVRDEDTPITGQYFKLPFQSEKKTYQFWDGSLKDATDLKFEAAESIEGLEVYRYKQVIEPTTVGELTAPASFFGIDQEGDVTLDRVYSNTRTLWVEPETGVIIRGQEEQNTVAEFDGEEVATITDVTIGYDDATVSDNVDTYSSLSSQLKVVRFWLPVVGTIAGLLVLLAGIVLVARGRRSRGGAHAAETGAETQETSRV